MVKVSVVIPVYNAEKHIEKTINSLLNQTFRDIEFIFVNDGSKDKSLDILREYEKKDNRVIVIDQENFGPGGARNTGILKARGEYIGFLDSDDTQDERMYELLYNKAIQDNFDMVMCNTVSVYPDKKVNVDAGISNDCYTDDDIKKCMIFSYAVVWNKLIKSDIVKQTLFSKNLWYEDVEFLFKLYPKIKKIGYVNEYLCNYIQTDNSITYTFNNKIYDLHTVMNNIVTQLKLSNSETYKYEIVNNIIRECNILCENGIVLDSLLLPKNEVDFVKDMLSKTTLKTEYECIIPKFEVFNNTITIVDFRVLECYSSKDLWRVADLIFSCNDEQEV